MPEDREIPPPKDPGDLYVLGGMYFQGLTVPADKEKAIKLYEMSADGGNVDAMVRLGIIYMLGDGAEKDRSKSFSWFGKAADAGDNDSRYFLALHYSRGWGTEKNPSEAVRLCILSADAGCLGAMTELGIWYREGKNGLPTDVDESLRWLRKAVDRDYADAIYEVGCMYAFGEGVPKDGVYGRELLRIASTYGDEDATEALEAARKNAKERP